MILKRFAALLLAVLILVMCPVRAYAAGVGTILGGITGGLGLTLGEAAALILAVLGVGYSIEQAASLEISFQDCLDAAVDAEQAKYETNAAMQAEVEEIMASWIESAKAGYIELESGAKWIVDAVKSWGEGFLTGSYLISVPSYYIFGDYHDTYLFDNGIYYRGPLRVFYWHSFVYSEDGLKVSHRIKRVLVSIIPDSAITFDTSVDGSFESQVTTWLDLDSGRYSYVSQTSSSGWGTTGVHDVNWLEEYFEWVFIDNDPSIAEVISGYFSGEISIPVQAVYPQVIGGGISDQLAQGIGMDVIGLRDVEVPGADVFPVNPSDYATEGAAVTDYLLSAYLAGEITWEQLWELLGVYSPTVGTSAPTITTTDTTTGTTTNEEILTGGTTVPVTAPAISEFQLDLTQFFPFCIPFDIYEFLKLLAAEPEAPHWEFDIEFPYMEEPWHLVIDLSAWDGVAALFRKLELFAFIIGLAVVTRELYIRS